MTKNLQLTFIAFAIIDTFKQRQKMIPFLKARPSTLMHFLNVRLCFKSVTENNLN